MLTRVRGAVPGSKNFPELAHAWQGSVSAHRLPVLCSANTSGGQATATIRSPGFGPGVHSSCVSPRANTFCTHARINTQPCMSVKCVILEEMLLLVQDLNAILFLWQLSMYAQRDAPRGNNATTIILFDLFTNTLSFLCVVRQFMAELFC